MSHIHEKIDFTVTVLIVHDNKLLMHVHKKLHIWLPPGGHIELDEDPNQAALREAKEETGLNVELVGRGTAYDSKFGARDLIPPRFLNRHFFDSTRAHEHVDLAFFARPVSAVSEVRHEVEGGEIRWFSKEDIEGGKFDILPDVRTHALAALEELAS